MDSSDLDEPEPGDTFGAPCRSNRVRSILERNVVRSPSPGGARQPNELGLYDMSGNIWEWCSTPKTA